MLNRFGGLVTQILTGISSLRLVQEKFSGRSLIHSGQSITT